MANYYATVRTNYVQIEDLDGLMEALEPFQIQIGGKQENLEGSGNNLYCFTSGEDNGWPTSADVDDGPDEEFSFESCVMPYIKEGECLVCIEVGNEKLRYLRGYAEAYVRRGDKVEHTSLDLNYIYKQAQEELGCENTTVAEY